MCVSILRSIGSELTKIKICKNCMFYLTSRDAKTVQPEVCTTSGSKVMAQIVVFVFSVTLTFDLCSIVCHTHCA